MSVSSSATSAHTSRPWSRWTPQRSPGGSGGPELATASVGDLGEDPGLLAIVRQAVDRANAVVSRAESIRRFRNLDAYFAVGAELTPTQKVRRHYVLDKYAAEIEALYE